MRRKETQRNATEKCRIEKQWNRIERLRTAVELHRMASKRNGDESKRFVRLWNSEAWRSIGGARHGK